MASAVGEREMAVTLETASGRAGENDNKTHETHFKHLHLSCVIHVSVKIRVNSEYPIHELFASIDGKKMMIKI